MVSDVICNHLRKRIGLQDSVEAGTVIATTAGALKRTNNVKAVLHVAAQHGEPGRGYVTIRSYPDCIINALEAIDDLNRSWRTRFKTRTPLKSVIFPLLGTRGAERDPQVVTDRLVIAARDHIERTPDSLIERICFLAFTDRDDHLCEAAFRHADLKYIDSNPA